MCEQGVDKHASSVLCLAISLPYSALQLYHETSFQRGFEAVFVGNEFVSVCDRYTSVAMAMRWGRKNSTV